MPDVSLAALLCRVRRHRRPVLLDGRLTCWRCWTPVNRQDLKVLEHAP